VNEAKDAISASDLSLANKARALQSINGGPGKGFNVYTAGEANVRNSVIR
jgi:hypothetical protein